MSLLPIRWAKRLPSLPHHHADDAAGGSADEESDAAVKENRRDNRATPIVLTGRCVLHRIRRCRLSRRTIIYT